MTLEKSIAENGAVYGNPRSAASDQSEPFARIEVITPELAERWLKTMAPNRKVNPKHVEKLVRDMEAGRWMVSPQGIGFGRDGSPENMQTLAQALLDALERIGVLEEGLDEIRSSEIEDDPLDHALWAIRLAGETLYPSEALEASDE